MWTRAAVQYCVPSCRFHNTISAWGIIEQVQKDDLPCVMRSSRADNVVLSYIREGFSQDCDNAYKAFGFFIVFTVDYPFNHFLYNNITRWHLRYIINFGKAMRKFDSQDGKTHFSQTVQVFLTSGGVYTWIHKLKYRRDPRVYISLQSRWLVKS